MALNTIFCALCPILLLLATSAWSEPALAQDAAPPVVISPGESTFAPTFQKHDGPVFPGQYIASDPSILVVPDGYRMYYTCFIVPETGFVPEEVRAGICAATSSDGLSWTEIDTGSPTKGLVLAGRPGSWEENLEAAFVIEIEGTYLLYYSGYDHIGNPALGFPAQLSVATFTDGIAFQRISDHPILSPTTGWYDNDAVYSPAVAIVDGELQMVYAGHCYSNCPLGYGVTLLGATSTDGISWTKRDQPVLQGNISGLDWTSDGVAEPGLLFGPDGQWHLFFTALQGDLRQIGLATGATPFGPWTVLDQPVLTPSPGAFDEGGVLAPFLMLENGALRMWYLGQSIGEQILAIGYAEATLPSS